MGFKQYLCQENYKLIYQFILIYKIMNEELTNQAPGSRKGIRHMGEMVQKAVENSKMSVVNFAKSIHCSRTNVYSIFGRQQIDINRLKQISSVLNMRISDFIMEEKNNIDRYIAIVEVNNEKLQELLNEQCLKYIKHWKIA